ncbi:carboxylate--amine ligase [Streptomyces paludis]|uniref:carboxylate--amine ligase n=1 Tax=Streptomyces paludis TaxID=2282738 RepID=UPI0015F2E56B|nr:ATP-grasp domain-containing protein [Streptomyces paludis]
MPSFDTRVPAVLLRLDRNPFHHGTLGAVRSLGRAGIEVHAVVESARSPVGRSRYLHRAHLRPLRGPDLTPAPDFDGTARLLLGIADGLAGPAVLVPMDDLSAIAVARLRERLTGRYLLPEQPSGLPERVADKAELAGICRELDIPHPRTVVPGCAAEAAAAAWSLGLPVVAKWSRPWLLPEGTGLRSTQVVRSPREARELYGRAAEAGSGLLLQEFLAPGPDLDWFFHGYGGGPGRRFLGAAGRKERAWPVGAGLTAVGRWLPNPEVERTARQLVSALGYRGILDLDFRRDAASGAYHLLDFNPRPGAQFRLFTDRAGVDVVRALHLDLTGRTVPAQEAAHGRTFVVENYALLSVLASARSAAPRPSPSGARAAAAGTETAWCALDDPWPAGAMAVAWALHAVRRGWRRLRRALPSRRRAGGGGRSRTPPVRQRRGSPDRPDRPHRPDRADRPDRPDRSDRTTPGGPVPRRTR